MLKNNVVDELVTDFDALSHTSMAWDKATWGEQAKEGRFDGELNWDHKFIFWFESYPAVMAAKQILREMSEDYAVLVDNATDEYALTTTFVTPSWSKN